MLYEKLLRIQNELTFWRKQTVCVLCGKNKDEQFGADFEFTKRQLAEDNIYQAQWLEQLEKSPTSETLLSIWQKIYISFGYCAENYSEEEVRKNSKTISILANEIFEMLKLIQEE